MTQQSYVVQSCGRHRCKHYPTKHRGRYNRDIDLSFFPVVGFLWIVVRYGVERSMFCRRSHRSIVFTVLFGGCLLCVVFYLNGDSTLPNKKGLHSALAVHKVAAGLDGKGLQSWPTGLKPYIGVNVSLAEHAPAAVIPSRDNSGSANNDVESAKRPTVRGAPSTTSLPCTQADIARRSATIVLTSTNAAFLDITENMLESIKRTRACPNITVIAEDEPSYQRLTQRIQSQPGLHVTRSHLTATESESLKLHSPAYIRLVNRRPGYVLNLLKKGYDVLFVDSDTVWFKDPFKDFQDSFDVAMHNERVNAAAFCDGFAYYRAAENTIRFVTEWVRLLDINNTSPDQNIMNQMILTKRFPKLKIKTLNGTNYPDGKKYFLQAGWRETHNDTTVLHATFILGHDAKVAKLKEFGFWFI